MLPCVLVTDREGVYKYALQEITARKIGSPLLVRDIDLEILKPKRANAYHSLAREGRWTEAQYLYSSDIPKLVPDKKRQIPSYLRNGRVIA